MNIIQNTTTVYRIPDMCIVIFHACSYFTGLNLQYLFTGYATGFSVLNIWRYVMLVRFLSTFMLLVAILVTVSTKLTKTNTMQVTLRFQIWTFLCTRLRDKAFFDIKLITDDKLYILYKYCRRCISKLGIEVIFSLYFMFLNLVKFRRLSLKLLAYRLTIKLLYSVKCF